MKKNYFVFLIIGLLGVNFVTGQEIDEEEILTGERGDLCTHQLITITKYKNICNNTSWKLVFEENFNGNSLDLNFWEPKEGVPRDDNFNQQKAWHLPENIEVNNGTLKIISKKLDTPYIGTWVIDWTTRPPTYKVAAFDYTTGEIWTKLRFTHGKLEGRIKIPKGWGFWPAFWMFGNPPWNEIDVFEFGNEWKVLPPVPDYDLLSKVHHMAVHYDGHCPGTTYIGPDFSEDFHVFTMTWDENRIRWYVDGVLKKTHYHYYSTGLIFPPIPGVAVYCDLNPGIYWDMVFPHDPMSIILNIAIQHNNGNDPNRTTPFPSQMEVDYVRFYQRLPCYNESKLFTSPANIFNFKDGAFNSVVGTTIKMGDGFTLENKQHLSARAEEKIVLQSGFTAKAGCTFTAKLDPFACTSRNGNEDEMEEDGYFAPKDPSEITSKKTTQINSLTDEIIVYPNPAKDKVIIEIPYRNGKVVKYRIQMLNSQGIIIQTYVTEEYRIEIDLVNFLQGIYLLNLANIESGEMNNYKIVKY